jgi:hypothetical protein
MDSDNTTVWLRYDESLAAEKEQIGSDGQTFKRGKLISVT